jgi:hypothetical protein
VKKVEILCEKKPESFFWKSEVGHRDQKIRLHCLCNSCELCYRYALVVWVVYCHYFVTLSLGEGHACSLN